MVGLMNIDKEYFIFDSLKEVIGLMSNFGIICFEKGTKKVLDFIPIADSKISKGNNKKVIVI